MLSSGLFGLAICVALLAVSILVKTVKRRRLPPGPPPTPAVGNVRGFDVRYPWKSYAKWAEEYGDIIYTRLLTQDIMVISSEKIAQELLQGRSQNYSSRPAGLCVMVDFLGAKFSSILLPAAPSFRPIQLQKAHDLIMHLISNPGNYPEHLQIFSISTIMSIVYDYEASGKDDPFVAHVARVLDIGQNGTRSELTAIILAFPFPKFLPDWFPGTDFKRKALISRETIAGWVEAPFEYVRNSMAEGTADPSMVSDDLLRIRDIAPTEGDTVYLEQAVKEACARAYIDHIAPRRNPLLPYWDDQFSLPYVEAVVKETLRWYPVVPLGVPHATIDDGIYKGYYIPKGATVIANVWTMSRDSAKFPEPEKFKPERFLVEETQMVDQLSFVFGFGRRVCVGRYVADASLWILIVSMLAVFRFEAPPSWNPGPDGINVEWTSGISSHPKDVPCIIKPRHKDVSSEKLACLVGLVAL